MGYNIHERKNAKRRGFMIFDLHIHTIFSDGLLLPEKVVKLAMARGMDGIAITDHDTINGIEPALKYKKLFKDFHVIPGIEFGTIYNDEEVHILGYFIDYKSKKIIEATEELRANRIKRGMKIVEKLNSLGIKLSYAEVKEYSKDDYIGRPHIANAMVNKGYVKDIKEAFEKYLNRGKEAYVQRETFTLEETIKLIHEAKGIAVLAHPGLLKNKDIIKTCIEYGIDGLEAIHSKHKEKDVKMCIEIAKNNNLIITGGSDCHGRIVNGDYLMGKYYVNIDYIPQAKGRL